MVLWKGNVLEIFLLGERRGEKDTANIYHKERSYKTQNVVELAKGILRRRVMALAVSDL
jgi:hypothetical protein